jgi:DnaJ-related protein SCJ1
MRLRLGPALLLLLLCLTALVVGDYYEDLGLASGEDATDSEIKRAYRTLTKLYHPDHNPSEEARPRYLEISRAYEVLADPKKRKIYDMKGEEGLKQLEEAEKSGGRPSHPFAMFFGGGGGGDQTRGSNMNLAMKVALEDIYNGRTHEFTIKKQKLCRACKGTGAKAKSDLVKCTKCKGTGSVVQRMQLAPGFVQQVQAQCPVCSGKGTTVKAKCPVCGGARVKRGDAKLELLIEQGMPEGHAVTFEMEADESPDVIPGDVIVTLTTHPHPLFKRSGDNLAMPMRISLLESLGGFRRTFEHLDRRVVEVASAPGAVTPHGHAMVLPGEGMPRHHVPSEMGSLTITFEVVFPTTITPEQAEGFRRVLGTAA